MTLTEVKTSEAPAAIGPYSQAIKAGPFIYTSGQVALDPASGQLIEGGIKEQTVQVLNNLKAVLQAAGGSLQNVVKTTVFLQDINDFQAMNSIYAEYFQGVAPARSTVQVAALPKGALVEIECVCTLS